jgi:ferredoxin
MEAAVMPEEQPTAAVAVQEPNRCVRCGSEFLVAFYKGDGQVQNNIFPEQAALTEEQAKRAEQHQGPGSAERVQPYCVYGCSQELTPVQVRLQDMAKDERFQNWLGNYNPSAKRDIGPAQMLLMWDAFLAAQVGMVTEGDVQRALHAVVDKHVPSKADAGDVFTTFWAAMDKA